MKTKARKAEVTVERLGTLPRAELDQEAQRVAELRGAADVALVLG